MHLTAAIKRLNESPRHVVRAALCGGLLAAASPALADAVTDWNKFADGLPMGPPPFEARIMSMVQLAVHDALNSIDPRYALYADLPPATPGALAEAAVAAAAHDVLFYLNVADPDNKLEGFYAEMLADAGCPGAGCEEGTAAGQAAALAIVALRVGDGSDMPNRPYTLLPAPGVYQPNPVTPPAAPTPPQFAGWAHLTPFVLNSGSQFRADPSEIFNLTSNEYARDYNEVKRVGSRNATPQERTPEQSETARFWPSGGANWNAVTREIVGDHDLDLWEHARLFALVNVALSDSAVAVFDTKYTYNFWRPVTAIRAGDSDGNSRTVADAGWESYQGTPPYPDYTCGLTTNAGAAAEVLRRYFGTDELPYTLTAAGITRSFDSLSDATADAVDARVFGGMHFRSGCVRGVIQGAQVGRFVIQHALKASKQ